MADPLAGAAASAVERALGAVAASIASQELSDAVGPEQIVVLRTRVARAEADLAATGAGGGSPLEALYQVARQCLCLGAAMDRDFDDGSAADTFVEGEVGWDFGVAVAEVAANGLAALVLALECDDADEEESLEFLECLGLDLDFFAAYIFGGLTRLGAEQGLLSNKKARLNRALQGICAWAMEALSLVVGPGRRFTGNVLWEWASQDAVWSLVLAKGVLSLSPQGFVLSPIVLPADLDRLQQAVLGAVVGLASTGVAFAQEAAAGIDEDAVPIAGRSAELARHRAELAAAAVNCQLSQSLLVSASAHPGADAGPGVASFFAALLQPDLASEPAWGSAYAETVGEARMAASALAERLRSIAGMLWRFLATVPGACSASAAPVGGGGGGGLPLAFLQDCADLAFFVPPSTEDLVIFVGCALLACPDNGSGSAGDAAAAQIAALCVVFANAGVSPEGALLQAITSLCAEARSDVVGRWQRWRGPVRQEHLMPWISVGFMVSILEAAPCFGGFSAPELAPPAPVPPPAELRGPAPPPGRGGTVLRELVREAPSEFRCALDGQLMMDPVRTPQGHVFERSGLARALLLSTSSPAGAGGAGGGVAAVAAVAAAPATGGGHCPLTGAPLSMEECQRLPELRRKILRWVREHGPTERARPHLAAAAARGAAPSP